MNVTRFVVVGVVVAANGLVACTAWSDTYINSRENQAASGDEGDGGATTMSSSAGSSTAPACNGSFVKADLSKLKECSAEGAKGHCYAKDKVPQASILAPCADANDVCVPDEILTAGGAKLKSCKSLIGPGACITGLLIPQLVAQGGKQLKPDVCDASQLCVPCADPGGADTGMCGVMGVVGDGGNCSGTGPAADAGTTTSKPLEGCCTTKGVSNGVCIDGTQLTSSQRSQTKQDTCTGSNVCAPRAFVENKPVTCDAGILFGKGVCLDQCFDGTLKTLGGLILERSVCKPTELCIPCDMVKGQNVPGCQ